MREPEVAERTVDPLARRLLWIIVCSPWVHFALCMIAALLHLRAAAWFLAPCLFILGFFALFGLFVLIEFRNDLKAREQLALILVGGLGGLLDGVIGGLSLLVMMD